MSDIAVRNFCKSSRGRVCMTVMKQKFSDEDEDALQQLPLHKGGNYSAV